MRIVHCNCFFPTKLSDKPTFNLAAIEAKP